MRGTIELQSVYGVGTSVTLAVPQQAVDVELVGDFEEEYLSAADKGEQYHQSSEAPGARILVVDDVAVIQEAFRAEKQSSGIEFHSMPLLRVKKVVASLF